MKKMGKAFVSCLAGILAFFSFFCTGGSSLKAGELEAAPAPSAEKLRFYYFNSTHWDREWYLPFQQYRKYLVDTAEILLDSMRQGTCNRFVFDGQSIVLPDICELRPSLRKELEKQVSSGKLLAGPWYVMPDEFLPSLEALIRNLTIGGDVVREFGGKPWPVGYVVDIFGHPAQMPQIFAGFGLEGTVVRRGFSPQLGPRLLWEGPDGTQIRTLQLYPAIGYGDFSYNARGKWDLPLSEKAFKSVFREYVLSRQLFFGDALPLSDAGDHVEPCRQTNQMLRWMQELYPNALVVHSDYLDYFQNEFGGTLPVAKGEQLRPQEKRNNSSDAPFGTLSSRYDVKRANDLAQIRMELSMEPQAVLRSLDGTAAIHPETLSYLWRTLVQNHAHDTICGCSVDQVHQESLVRYRSVMDLADIIDVDLRNEDFEKLTGKNMREMIFHAPHDGSYATANTDPEGKYLIRFFNPLPMPVDEVREFELPFDAVVAYPVSRGAEGNAFRLRDEQGREIPYFVKEIRRGERKIHYRASMPVYDCYTVVAKVSLRPSGWTTLRLEPVSDGTVLRYRQSLLCGRMAAENGKLRLEIQSDGTFSVTDLRSGVRRSGFNRYLMTRDIGDGWGYAGAPGTSALLDSSRSSVKLVQNGPDRVEFEIDRWYQLPKQMEYRANSNGKYRGAVESAEQGDLLIRTFVAMDRESDSLTLRTEMENTIRDYCLQLEIPTGIPGPYFSSQLGAVLQRNPGLDPAYSAFVQEEQLGKNFDGILGKRDEKGGVALISLAGIHEGGTMLADEKTLFVTLLRAFYKAHGTNGEPGGELLQPLEWNYRLRFFPPSVENAELFQEMQRYRTPVYHYMLPVRLLSPTWRQQGENSSFCTISGQLVFSALKPARDGAPKSVVIRLFNPSGATASGKLVFDRKIRKASLCRLDETVEREFSVDGESLELTAGPWKYLTLKLQF